MTAVTEVTGTVAVSRKAYAFFRSAKASGPHEAGDDVDRPCFAALPGRGWLARDLIYRMVTWRGAQTPRTSDRSLGQRHVLWRQGFDRPRARGV